MTTLRSRRFFADKGDELAVAVIEPLPANNGLLVQRKEFLEKLRTLTSEHGALLLFDEVISGFRLGKGGASEHYEITPDLVTFGKIMGGGMPVGAFGGSQPLMDHLAPEGPVYQAGTLSGNPVAMAAGLSTLEVLEQEDAWNRLEAMGQRLENGLASATQGRQLPFRLVRLGSLFWLAPLGQDAVRSAEALPADFGESYKPIHGALLEQAIYLAPSAYEVGFLSIQHDEVDVDRLVSALASFAS